MRVPSFCGLAFRLGCPGALRRNLLRGRQHRYRMGTPQTRVTPVVRIAVAIEIVLLVPARDRLMHVDARAVSDLIAGD